MTDRFRSLPMSQSAVLSGRSAADLLNAVLGLAVMTAAGLLVGWRFETGIANAALAFALLLLLRLAVIWVGLGLRIEAEGVVAVHILVWPVGFLSSVFVAPSTMPSGWARSPSGIPSPRPSRPSAACSATPGSAAPPGSSRTPS